MATDRMTEQQRKEHDDAYAALEAAKRGTDANAAQLEATLAGMSDGVSMFDADLTDGHGKGLPGAVAAVVFDAYGGGSDAALSSLDTRSMLCSAASVEFGSRACPTMIVESPIFTSAWRMLPPPSSPHGQARSMKFGLSFE